MRLMFRFDQKPLTFIHPERIFVASSADEIPHVLADIEIALRQGLYVAGFFSYEAGVAMNGLPVRGNFPLIVTGCFKEPRRDAGMQGSRGIVPRLPASQPSCDFKISAIRMNMTRDEYFERIQRIRDYIAAGEVYQITYCLKILFDFTGSPDGLYASLLDRQDVPYAAFLDMGDRHILSLSPELFFKKTGTDVVTKPMKGSWPLGVSAFADALAAWRLRHDRKNRAENVMIADLLRNDLGRIGREIRCPKLFEVTRYKTICQMTSTVRGRVPRDIPLAALMSSLLPSGSVTGAPKMRAMQIISELEREERKIYTGAIGYITPRRDMFFNVPIRTVLLEGGKGELGIGGGIVWDSTPENEWAETMWKARFFMETACKVRSKM